MIPTSPRPPRTTIPLTTSDSTAPADRKPTRLYVGALAPGTSQSTLMIRAYAALLQGTIELKLGDTRSGTDLFNTIRDQLLVKYMAADECRAGCLLVTIAKGREWEHPKTGKRIGFEELMIVLNEEADRLSKELGGTAKLMVKGLDLRPRLGKERRRAS